MVFKLWHIIIADCRKLCVLSISFLIPRHTAIFHRFWLCEYVLLAHKLTHINHHFVCIWTSERVGENESVRKTIRAFVLVLFCNFRGQVSVARLPAIKLGVSRNRRRRNRTIFFVFFSFVFFLFCFLLRFVADIIHINSENKIVSILKHSSAIGEYIQRMRNKLSCNQSVRSIELKCVKNVQFLFCVFGFRI